MLDANPLNEYMELKQGGPGAEDMRYISFKNSDAQSRAMSAALRLLSMSSKNHLLSALAAQCHISPFWLLLQRGIPQLLPCERTDERRVGCCFGDGIPEKYKR